MKRIALALALVVMAAGACRKAEDRGMADTTRTMDTTRMDTTRMDTTRMGDTTKMRPGTTRPPRP